MKEYVTLSDIAKMFHVSERHLFRLRAMGRLPPPISIGRCKRWDPEEVRKYFEQEPHHRVTGQRSAAI